MNLFSSTEAPTADPVQTAIRNAATSTGATFDYLLSTAKRESGLDPAARAATSSATGLFQFIDSTWLQMVKEAGPALGLGNYAEGIEKTAGGGYVATDPGTRQAILALRNDPSVNALMAGALTQQNRQLLAGALGREPSQGELYIAHFMGAQGASSLIRLAATDSEADAATAFPRQAGANPRIFYDGSGAPKSVGAVYAGLVALFDAGGGQPATVTGDAAAKLPASPAAWLAIPARNAYAAEAAPFHGLFRSDAGAPISNYVAATWSNLGPAASAAASPPAAIREDGAATAPARAALPAASQAPLPAVSQAPLPAPRPGEEGLLSSFGAFFTTLFAASQTAPLRDGKAWGG